ncbi:ABC transporter ATP-binding protein [Paenibacillus aquistagni]|uniref:Putative ABC transport system ATP-binding protein/putative ABC transport system ATP-binding protein n=1 Tax=Paenibacillus aquistagni TaxID=1852522 RepID=A0A1X7JK90_9BACL|nr:ABC transporter ATP-binding protein [Paenibacillus aquistagni]SMG28585.1 putative ABC transport system ATP-binding protein/putative ABC transport system ATP-binding protein [Paenibacillus aquistagni]
MTLTRKGVSPISTVLRAEQVTKIYGNKKRRTYTALQDIHLEVQEGEFVGIMGPSGSGKTTLLNILATIDKPTAGQVYINDVNPAVLSDRKLALFRRHALGYVFQDFNLLDTLTIKENILLPLALERTSAREIEAKVQEMSAWLGIESILDKRTYEVSGGQMQRTAIARAMIHQPSLLLADELTGNLDSKSAKDVMQALEDMNEAQKRTILIVTHDPFAASYCKRVIFIKDGRLFTEIRKGSHRQAFFQKILDTLSLLGGSFDDLSTPRH